MRDGDEGKDGHRREGEEGRREGERKDTKREKAKKGRREVETEGGIH